MIALALEETTMPEALRNTLFDVALRGASGLRFNEAHSSSPESPLCVDLSNELLHRRMIAPHALQIPSCIALH